MTPAAASGVATVFPGGGGGRGGGSVSNISVVARRNQQAARRTARNRDKVVIAAERCLIRVLDLLLADPQFRYLMTISHIDRVDGHVYSEHNRVGMCDTLTPVKLSEEEIRLKKVSYFPADMRNFVSTLMRW